ncbi:predicted protein [Histoplasma capsulatum H143]|uniref:Uncharacterized protein n=1 Tax=Ajellomyces capsulatus (strain H143) TaxID=544712 RepID=C6HT89_AJECH|nr:predicted protein [Histoplasma capsulatum H143]
MASMDPSSSSSGDEPMTQNKWPPRLETPKQQRKGTSIQRSGLGKGHSKLQPGLCGDCKCASYSPLFKNKLARILPEEILHHAKDGWIDDSNLEPMINSAKLAIKISRIFWVAESLSHPEYPGYLGGSATQVILTVMAW